MAIAAASSSSPTMSLSLSHSHSHEETTNEDNINSKSDNDNDDDDHEHDMVMPGFRFHPTEEELVEFYLRRKVEGKRFNVELITFLDLYRYDPWELPALAAIGEKEWYFYVPRDRKYRNGDRPNRVTTSGYWKATGADRMIRTENFRSIGLKKTLVFYSGKAPKGIRTSWIMNEYRLPQHETERYQKAEISLCRVYKRAGVEDHPSLPRSLPARPSSSRGGGGGGGGSQSHNSGEKNKHSELQQVHQNMSFVVQEESKAIDLQIVDKFEGSSSGIDLGVTTSDLGVSKYNGSRCSTSRIPLIVDEEEEEALMMMQQQQQQQQQSKVSNSVFPIINNNISSCAVMDDLNRLVSYQQQQQQHQQQQEQFYNHINVVQPNPNHLSTLLMQQPILPMSLNSLPNPLPTNFSDRLWDWNPIPDHDHDPDHDHEHNNTSFK